MNEPDQTGIGWTVVLRRQTAQIVEGQAEGGYTDAYELVCCQCGDHPDTSYRELSAELRQIRGPYPIAAGIEAYGRHVSRYHRPRTTARPRGAITRLIRLNHPQPAIAAWLAQP